MQPSFLPGPDAQDGIATGDDLSGPLADTVDTADTSYVSSVDLDAGNLLSQSASADPLPAAAVLDQGEDVVAFHPADPLGSATYVNPVVTEVSASTSVTHDTSDAAANAAPAAEHSPAVASSMSSMSNFESILPGENGGWSGDVSGDGKFHSLPAGDAIIIGDWVRLPVDVVVVGDNGGDDQNSGYDYSNDGSVIAVGDGDTDTGNNGEYSGYDYSNYDNSSYDYSNYDNSGYDYSYSYSYSYTNTWVAGGGDVNGDGIGDCIVTTYNGGGQGGNSVYVVFGQGGADVDPATLDGTNGFRIVVPANLVYSYSSVSVAGDINGDGMGDLIVDVFGADALGKYSDTSYIIFGGTGSGGSIDLAALDGSNGFRVGTPQGFDYSSSWVSAAGDVNGDGFADLLVGSNSRNADGSYMSESYVILGSAAGFAAVVSSGVPETVISGDGYSDGDVFVVHLDPLPTTVGVVHVTSDLAVLNQDVHLAIL